ncbi:MAG: purine-binding chemotaxis protein CheW [Actinomycetota bacterium]|nr:purine-binding chemotaxis protein CheW [Actinomycetota bacterium]
MADHGLLATFAIADMWCAVDVRHVREVLLDQELAAVPMAPTGVIGLLNLRGQVLAAVDLRALMALPPRAPGESAIHYIVEHGDAVESMVVDRAGAVVDTADLQRRPVPETTPPAIASMLECAYQNGDEIVLMVRLDEVHRKTGKQVR